ncbi:MAG: hypothetical protein H6719_17995 [Sandaracinaceae bacterium]|nr:hypothetical protein [Sandaracinaceae bacterium]
MRLRLVAFLPFLLAGCSRCAPPRPVEEPLPEEEAAAAPSVDPPIAAPIPLNLVIEHPPAVAEVQESPAACTARGSVEGPERGGIAEAVAVGPAGAAAVYPTDRLPNEDSTATVQLLGPDGAAREPAELTIRGLLTRMEPLEDGFVIVTGFNDFSVGLVRHYHAYVIDGAGRFGGHVEVTPEGYSQLDGIGSGGPGVLRFFFAPNPSFDLPMVVVEVRRGDGGELVRSDVSLPVHVLRPGAAGRSMVVALPPAEAALALVLHPDAGPELLRGGDIASVEALADVRGSWLVGNPVRAVLTDEGTVLHVAGDGGGVFAVEEDGVRRLEGAPQLATGLGEEAPVLVRMVGGQVEVVDTDSPQAATGAIAWHGTTMAHLAGQRLSLLSCAR